MEETTSPQKSGTMTNLLLLALVFILGGSAFYFYTADDHNDHAHDHGDAHHMHVESQRDFVAGMIPHHEEAVVTSRILLAQGGTTEDIRALAEEIIRVQEEEIAQLKTWHEEWYDEAYVDDESYMPMMRSLEGLSGVELDRTYLEDMIVHHEGAILMAEEVMSHITHEEIRAMANDIMTTQSAEIALIREYLEGLGE